MPREILIEARNVSRLFPVRNWRAPPTRAVDRVSLHVCPGETVALVGESGSGKSTLGRMLLGLEAPTEGEIRFRGEALQTLSGEGTKKFRRLVQVVFQDSGAALNPRRTIGQSVELPLRHNLSLPPGEARARADALLERVELAPARFRDRLPHELSGGQRQRVGIARAVACRPAFVVADEPVSALDVSVRAQVLKLMRDLQAEYGLSYLFITHDLGVVRAIADRVAVMYRGAIVESGPAAPLLRAPRHPYTQALLAAVPVPDPAVPPPIVLRERRVGEINLASGCRYRDRCPRAAPICENDPPPAVSPDGTSALCHFAARA
jgi:oligopeptide/dipeptide ABC transporter ATP-binding protein